MTEILVDRADSAPELGTTRSAVMACVNMMANALEVRETQLIYWLDCYYQLRVRFETEHVDDLDAAESQQGAVEAQQDGVPSELSGFETVAAKRSPSAVAAEFKRQTYSRLIEARKRGIPISAIAAGDPDVSENQILSILEGKKLMIEVYRALANALDKIEGI